MKRFLKFFCLGLCLLFSSMLLSACFGSNGSSSSKKVTITEEMIYLFGTEKYYDEGNPITYDYSTLKINLPDRVLYLDADFTATYKDNVNVGTATITITVKEDNQYAQGSVDVHFQIRPYGDLTVNSLSAFKEALEDQNHSYVYLEHAENYANFVIEEDEEIIIPENKIVYLETGNSEIYNYGKFENYGKLHIASGSTYCYFYNIGEFVSHSLCINQGRIFNSGIFNAIETMSNAGQVYTDTPINCTTEAGGYRVYKERTMLSDENVTLLADSVRYGVNDNKVSFQVTGGSSINLTSEYSYSEDIIGTASVKVSALLFNTDFGGSVTKTFQVLRGETTFSTFAELKEKQATGYYDTYTYSKPYSITVDENFEIKSYETVSLYYLNTTAPVVNSGTLNVSRELSVGANFTNNNSLYASSLKGSGDVTLSSTSTARFSSVTTNFSGRLVNNGNLVVANAASLSQNFTNTSTANIDTLNLLEGTSLVNSGELTISNSIAYCDFSNANIYNTGTITNAAKIALDNRTSTFENVTNGFVNNGTIYCYNPLQNLTQNVIVRTNLADATLTLKTDDVETYAFDYDKQSHRPTLYVDGSSSYSTTSKPTYSLVSGSGTAGLSVGTTRVTLTISDSDKYCSYFGTNSCDYEIVAVWKEVSTAADLTSALYYDPNWLGYRLTEDISVSAASSQIYAIYEDQTLNLNGHNLKIENGTINCAGTILVDELSGTQTLDNCGLVLLGTARLNLTGSLVNNGKVYVSESGATIDVESAGTISGSGKVYSYTNGVNISSSKIYSRIIAQDATDEEIYLEATIGGNKVNLTKTDTHLTFNGSAQSPSAVAKYYSSLITPTEDHFDVVVNNGEDCVQRGTYEVSLSTKDIFDLYFIGSTTRTFTIDSHHAQISNASQWTQTTFDDQTYDQFDLMANISVTNNISLRPNTILNFGSYRIQNLDTKSITADETNEIWIDVSNVSDYNTYRYVATKITLQADITSDEIGTLNFTDSLSSALKINGSDRYRLTIDLNGHNITKGISISNTSTHAASVTITNSSSTTSVISPASTSYNGGGAVWLDARSASETSLNIIGNNKNIVVRKLCIVGGGHGKSNINVYASSCIFNTEYTSLDNALQIANTATDSSSHFVDCDFAGFRSVEIYGGNSSTSHTFEGCTFHSTDSYSSESDGAGIYINGPATSSSEYSYIDITVYVYNSTIQSDNGVTIYAGWAERYDRKVSVYLSGNSYQKSYKRDRFACSWGTSFIDATFHYV